MRTDDMVEGDLRYSLTCNLCGHVEEVTTQLPQQQRKLLEAVIRDHPESALRMVRDFAFQHGWCALPLANGEALGTADLCPRCMTLARALLREVV